MKNRSNKGTSYRFIALFYLLLFVASTLFAGFGNMGFFPSFESGISITSPSNAKDSLGKGTLPASFPLSETEAEKARESQNSDEKSFDFDFTFSGVIRWVFGFIAPFIPSPSVRVSSIETPIWLVCRNLRI